MRRFWIWGLVCVAGTALAAAALLASFRLRFPISDAAEPLLIGLGLAGGAWHYHRRGVPQFALALGALLFITTFSACYSVLMYAAAASGRGLADGWLQATDAALGVHLPSIVRWTQEHPAIGRGLRFAYDSLLWQTPLVIIVLSFGRRDRELRGFVVQFMMAALVCAAVFVALPADGPFAAYGYPADATQARYLEHFHELRAGERTTATWRGAEGLITFPSFHTTWAILLFWAVRQRRGLRIVSGALNLAVIASTMTTGWHYFSDVLGGVAVAVGAILLERPIWDWCERQSRRDLETLLRRGLIPQPGIVAEPSIVATDNATADSNEDDLEPVGAGAAGIAAR
ncbi:MAG: phosphatase PAP2 family protein [Planctomyces sp.]|nr:phosphatase PAP2 family protein [Planctomyces sp.]